MNYGILVAGLLIALAPAYFVAGIKINGYFHTLRADHQQTKIESRRV
jgi:hypothetical protein